jgi:hypothetical protein
LHGETSIEFCNPFARFHNTAEISTVGQNKGTNTGAKWWATRLIQRSIVELR